MYIIWMMRIRFARLNQFIHIEKNHTIWQDELNEIDKVTEVIYPLDDMNYEWCCYLKFLDVLRQFESFMRSMIWSRSIAIIKCVLFIGMGCEMRI